jgi:poly(3-hydroxybutyrate) depolymerase
MRPRASRAAKIVTVAAALLALTLVRAAWKGRGSDPRPRGPLVLPVWTGADAAAPPLPARSPGCDHPGPTGQLRRKLHVAGAERTYLMVVPPAAGPTPLPVIIHFHGSSVATKDATPHPEVMAGRLPALPAVQAGAIFVAPDGSLFPRERKLGWYAACPSDDMDFFDALLAEVAASHCIDPRAVLLTGFSWGADMALAVACCRGDKVRALAIASGANLRDMPCCPAARLPALRMTYAENDPFYDRAELAGAVRFFRDAHRCGDGAPTDPAPCVAYRGCAQPVVECRYPRGGHQMPGGFAEDSWAFFSSLIAR